MCRHKKKRTQIYLHARMHMHTGMHKQIHTPYTQTHVHAQTHAHSTHRYSQISSHTLTWTDKRMRRHIHGHGAQVKNTPHGDGAEVSHAAGQPRAFRRQACVFPCILNAAACLICAPCRPSREDRASNLFTYRR